MISNYNVARTRLVFPKDNFRVMGDAEGRARATYVFAIAACTATSGSPGRRLPLLWGGFREAKINLLRSRLLSIFVLFRSCGDF